MKLLDKIFFPLKKLTSKEKITFCLILVLVIFVTFFDILTLYFIANIFNFKLDGLSLLKSNYVLEKITTYLSLDSNVFKISLFILVFSIILRNVFSFFQQLVVNKFIYGKYAKYSYKLLKTYSSSQPEKFFSKNYSFYLKNIVKETQYAFIGILFALISLVGDIFYLLILFFYCFYFLLNNFYSEFLIFLSLSFFFIIFFIYKLKDIGKEKTLNEEGVFNDAYETLLSYIQIKLRKNVDFFLNSFKKNISDFASNQVFFGSVHVLPKFIMEGFVAIGILFFFLTDSNPQENFSKIIVLGFVVFRFVPVVTRVAGSLNTYSFHYNSNKILDNQFKYYSLGKQSLKEVSVDQVLASIKLINATFKHSKNHPFLFKNLNIILKKNTITGIYGPSGHGKTTLLQIICGLLKLTKGKYFVNNVNLTNKSVQWNNRVSFMTQSSYIVDNSLIYSIFLDKEFIDPQTLEKARKLLKKFSLGYLIKFINKDLTDVSLRNTLSAGEKQRIVFIRCLLSNSDLLILDEPTSSLDTKNELLIMKELLKIKKNKIIIISSHKKELVKYFDKVLYLEKYK